MDLLRGRLFDPTPVEPAAEGRSGLDDYRPSKGLPEVNNRKMVALGARALLGLSFVSVQSHRTDIL